MNFNLISNDIAIDLGTSSTQIYIKGMGLVLDEPSVIALDNQSGEIIASGSEAYEMLGRTPPCIDAVFPLSGGTVSDCFLTEELLKCFLRRVCPKTLIKPRIIMSVPCGVTDVERRALRDAAVVVGARKVYIMESPIAAAIGANCDVTLARGMMIADFGGGSCDIAAISLGQTAASLSHKQAGGAFTEAIISYLHDRYSLSVGFITAERCKQKAGCVFSPDSPQSELIRGLNISSGLPQEVRVGAEEIKDALAPLCGLLADALRSALDETPSELVGDIIEDGILFTGGGAIITGLASRLRIDTGLKIFTAPDSRLCVVRGLAAAIENIDKIAKESYMLYEG